MPSLQWYVKRLGRMSAAEFSWRAGEAARAAADRCRMLLGAYPAFSADAHAHQGDWLRLTAAPTPAASAMRSDWVGALRRRADAIVAHEFSFGSLRAHRLGETIDWNRDHENRRAAPLHFAAGIDYRDFEVAGDAKVVWELNRHHQLVVLGRAWRATGDERYARELCAQLLSWMEQCPPGRGMNWRSPLELAIRAINWVWAIDLIAGSASLTSEIRGRAAQALDVHAWDISRKYSRASSANNHRIGEAAAVFIVSTCVPGIANAAALRDQSRAILAEEIARQTYADGCTREQALGYHYFVLHFFAAAAHAARRSGQTFPRAFWERLRAMIAFARALSAAGPPPLFGDADDGYVLDLGDTPGGWDDALAMAEAMLPGATVSTEPAFWLAEHATPAAPPAATPAREPLASAAFPESGYYLLQWGASGASDTASVLFDCGELGYGALAAHGHADALSFTLRAFGEDVLVDPGTFDYFTFPAWRRYFRTTRAHNTIEIDGCDQSTILGPFMWGARANARCTDWKAITAGGGRVAGEHDGYTRLNPPVVHHRELTLDPATRTLSIADRLTGATSHRPVLHWHCAEHARVERKDPHTIEMALARGRVTIFVDPRGEVTLLNGRESPIAGWVSRRYHQKQAATTIRVELPHGADHIMTRIEIGRPRP